MSGDRSFRGDTTHVSGPLPYVVLEATVTVAGTALHWRNSLLQILRNAGVSAHAVDEYRVSEDSKYKIMRDALGKLTDRGAAGWKVQRNIVAELVNLERPEPKAPDQEAGRRALADLRRLATEQQLLVSPEELERRQRRERAEREKDARTRRAEALVALNADFRALGALEDRQRRGYEFEKLINGLFQLDELRYDTSYKTEIDQVDGTVTIDAFMYLIEARWRQKAAVDADLAALNHKATNRLDATRAIFISMAGYRTAVLDEWRRRPQNKLVLVDGMDLALILEGRISMADGLREKIHAAGKDGEPFLPLRDVV